MTTGHRWSRTLHLLPYYDDVLNFDFFCGESGLLFCLYYDLSKGYFDVLFKKKTCLLSTTYPCSVITELQKS
jgi:hypothetical protein